MNRVAYLVDRTLNTSASPLTYLVALQSLIFGASFAFFTEETEVARTILYPYGLFMNVSLWGGIITVAALSVLVGLFTKSIKFTATGGFFLFTGWLFAMITYLHEGAVFLAALVLVNILYAGYLFLAANLGRLWNYTPQRK